MSTVAEIMVQVRRQLQDVVIGAYTWPDEELIGYVNEAHKEIISNRPKSALTDDESVIPVYTPTALTTSGQSLQIREEFDAEIINYVVKCAQNKDKE